MISCFLLFFFALQVGCSSFISALKPRISSLAVRSIAASSSKKVTRSFSNNNYNDLGTALHKLRPKYFRLIMGFEYDKPVSVPETNYYSVLQTVLFDRQPQLALELIKSGLNKEDLKNVKDSINLAEVMMMISTKEDEKALYSEILSELSLL